jgi:Uncharacterized protein conserved in bacteria
VTDALAPAETNADPIAETRRWVERAVIGLNLCPFAKAVYVKDQVRFVLSDASTPEALLEQLAEELVLLRDTPAEQIDTTLIVHPDVLQDFLDYNDFLDNADAAVERWTCRASCRWPASIRTTSSPAPRRMMRPTAPTVRRIRPCTCCARTAWSARWPRSRIRT